MNRILESCTFDGNCLIKNLDHENGPVPISCQQSSTPGVITQRSCAFYGARWMLAPLKDAIHLVHGPVGCAYYGGSVRGKSYRVFTSALTEQDIIYGGARKLMKAIREARSLAPQARYMFVYMTCAPSLIGDDITGLCEDMGKRLGCRILVVDCPGFKGESQSKGHKAAYEAIAKGIVGSIEPEKVGPFDVNIIGEYNINGETGAIRSLLARMGIRVNCVFTGDASYESICSSHRVKLNLVICQNTGKELARIMRDRFGIPYMKVSFFGMAHTEASLKKLSQYFGLEKKAQKVIEEEKAFIRPFLNQILPALSGKRAALFFGAAKMSLLLKALDEMGMEVIFTGSQFANKDTYRNAWDQAKRGTFFIDNASEADIEHLLSELHPHVFMGGTKENFLSHKLGVGFCLFPQPEICGPYVGFKGFLNLAWSIYKAIYAPVWGFKGP